MSLFKGGGEVLSQKEEWRKKKDERREKSQEKREERKERYKSESRTKINQNQSASFNPTTTGEDNCNELNQQRDRSRAREPRKWIDAM